ncbi:hypothetical protein CFE70_007713 [Pyrenophora teres f. teres 0-1]
MGNILHAARKPIRSHGSSSTLDPGLAIDQRRRPWAMASLHGTGKAPLSNAAAETATIVLARPDRGRVAERAATMTLPYDVVDIHGAQLGLPSAARVEAGLQ